MQTFRSKEDYHDHPVLCERPLLDEMVKLLPSELKHIDIVLSSIK